MKTARPLAVAAVTLALSWGTLGGDAHAARAAKPEPCAQQETQVAKAQQALDRVTAVFDHQQTKVERLQAALEAASTPEEKARIQARLDRALAQEQHARKAKKAQQQRLAKAQERLAACQAAQPAPRRS